MGSPKTYFLARGWDYASDSIRLGTVITNPTQPELAIFTPSPKDFDSPIHSSEKSQLTQDLAATNTTPGLFGTFLNQYGLGSEDNFSYDRKAVQSYSFNTMKSQTFEPTAAFINKAVAGNDRVAAFCRASGYKTPVYMITGIKTIRGAGVTATSSKGPGWLISLSLGSQDGSEGEPLPVVFAFQLDQLRLSADGEVSSTSDELWSADGEDVQSNLDTTFGEEQFTFTRGFDEEDGTPCQIIAPSLTSFDLLTASSARTDPSIRGNRKNSVVG